MRSGIAYAGAEMPLKQQILLRKGLVIRANTRVGNGLCLFFHEGFIPEVLVAFKKLPQRETAAKIDIFEQQIRPHYGRTHKVLPHHLREGGSHIRGDETLDAEDPLPEVSRIDIVLNNLVLIRLFGQLDAERDFPMHVPVGKRLFKRERRQLLVRAALFRGIDAQTDKGVQTVDESIEKTVLVGEYRFVLIDIQQF